MVKQADIVDHLREVSLFKFAKKRELQHIARHLEVMDVAENSTVVTEGEHGDAFYVILDGAAKVVRNGRTIARLGVGQYFGELALLDPAPRNATIVVTEPSTLGRLEAKPFEKVLNEVPTARHRLLSALAARARESGLKDASG